MNPSQHLCNKAPTSMIFLAKTCRCRVRKHENEDIGFFGLKNHNYANNLGFSDALNLKGDPFPQGAFGGKSYIPLSALQRKDLERIALDEGIEIGDAIQIQCEEIAKVVRPEQHPSY